MADIKKASVQQFSKGYSISYLVVSRLIVFAFLVLELLIVKIRRIKGMSKIALLKFSWSKRVKQNQKFFKNIENILGL